MLFAILFVIFVLLLTTWLRNYQLNSFFKTYQMAKLMQGPPLRLIFGSVQFLGLDAVQVYALNKKYSEAYPNGFRIWTPGTLVYVSYSADAVEAIITNSKNNRKSFAYGFLNNFLGNGLLTSSDPKWFQRRKILTPAFHFNMLRKFVPSMKHQTKILIDALMKEEQNKPNGTNLQEVISRFTLNTICEMKINCYEFLGVRINYLTVVENETETAMGVKLTKANELDEYRAHIHQYGHLHVERVITPWLHSNFMYKLLGKERKEEEITSEVHKFTSEIIANRRKVLSIDTDHYEDLFGKRRHAMLDTLLIAENNGQIDAAGIQEEVDTFVFEGYDTTSTAITFILLLIANHPDVQNRLYDEISRFYEAGRNSDDENLDVNHFSELEYLGCVIKESLRLFPPVPVIGRLLGEETMIDGMKLPSGTTIHVDINVLHRDPRHFPDPNKFDPERFTLKNSQYRHPFAYIPFSASHRNCIGQKFAMLEVKMVISKILKNFNLEPVTKIEDMIFKTDIILRTVDPVRIRFVSRC